VVYSMAAGAGRGIFDGGAERDVVRRMGWKNEAPRREGVYFSSLLAVQGGIKGRKRGRGSHVKRFTWMSALFCKGPQMSDLVGH
jgi:hypothetical protein